MGHQAKWNNKALPPAANKHISLNAPLPNSSFAYGMYLYRRVLLITAELVSAPISVSSMYKQ